ncbi:disulfide bond formation protein B [Glaciimonas immobilis]|uniref:Disulfide bond formation protein DsbB n=1 Tax=Glaciimonas immobilis TaxID=728004 RepID=A0A840RVY2_9BURK|nr:disulfide bond formation protein B [Glaciimonas immobilis]KAF3997585.1 disulfide bond formation protein B [Glaciimonas immobilis]MBB5200721.1 disulfide bond formation protein DsbB [Glaciimonas immobilis]
MSQRSAETKSSTEKFPGVSDGLNILALYSISLALGIAFYYQLVLHELPCPLCLLQRVGLIAIGIGFMMNVRAGVRSTHYGVAMIGALLAGIIGIRQVFLHIVPGRTNGYGSEIWGVHFYTLTVLSAIAAVLFIAVMLMLKTWERPNKGKHIVHFLGKYAMLIFTALIIANLFSTILECAAGQCEGNPTYYLLLGR